MITIHHNFDEKKFMWLWAKYVKAGNIDKHCTACLIGSYSRKFSGTSNQDLLSQPDMVMDEVPEGQYEAIYFCGVLKKGYLNKNLEKNNYRHNVHFAVRPQDGAHDVWDFEDWHVEIDGGVLEHIPATYELGDKFFKAPYNSHFYTCRIFRWMVGHFYPQELRDLRFGFPQIVQNEVYDNVVIDFPIRNLMEEFIKIGYEAAEYYFDNPIGDSENHPWEELSLESKEIDIVIRRNNVLKRGEFKRNVFFHACQVRDTLLFDAEVKVLDVDGIGHVINLLNVLSEASDLSPIEFDFNMACELYNIGMNEFLDMIAPYQDRSEVIL